MLNSFKQDVQRWFVPQQVAPAAYVTFSRTLRLMWVYKSLRAMFWLRLGTWCVHKRIPLAKSLFSSILYYFHGLELEIGADIGGGLYIAHPRGVVIVASRIGRNCSVIANVTVGMRNEYAFPEIGNDVFIGAGARVLGNIKIGDGAKIGANAVVIQDVPAGATVVGIPAHVISIDEAYAQTETD
jgi:serine O-acetyltransferase